MEAESFSLTTYSNTRGHIPDIYFSMSANLIKLESFSCAVLNITARLAEAIPAHAWVGP